MSLTISLLIVGLLLLVNLALGVILAGSVYWFWRTGVPYVATPRRDLAVLARMLQMQAQDTFVDMGCGAGRAVFLMEEFSPARVVGLEAMSWTHWLAKFKVWWLQSRAEFIKGDFFKHNIGYASVVYTYLIPAIMPKVGEKLKNECRSGTKVVCRDFPIPGWQAQATIRPSKHHKFYLYEL